MTRPLSLHIPAFLAALFCAACAVPQALRAEGTGETPRLAVSVDRTVVTVGDEIRYTVSVRIPAGFTVLPPDVGPEFGPFAVKRAWSEELKDKRPGASGRGWTFVLARFETGTTNIPGVEIRFKGPGGDGLLEARPVPVTVISVFSAGQTNVDIRDIKPQMAMRDPWLWLKLLILILGCAAGVAGVLFWRRLKKGVPLVAAQPEAQRPPADQEALEALDRIAASDVLEKEGIKQYYTLVSEVVRNYLARRYGVATLERTTEEILGELSGLYIGREIVEAVRLFLEESDMVKFAKHEPDRNEVKGLVDKARAIVLRTRPEPVPAARDGGVTP